MNEKLLEDIGLSKGEIKAYFALLKLGETTTGKIIEETQMSSGKIYEILDKLAKKGLVSYIIKEKTKYFNASSPKRILDYLKNKAAELKIKEVAIMNEIPKLLDIEKLRKKNYETKLFVGIEGFKTAIWETLDKLTSKDEILAMGIYSQRPEKFNLLWPHWHKERIKRKINCRAIFSEKKTEYYNTFKKMKYTKIKDIKGITPASIDIMGEYALILTHGDNPSCLIIKHPEIIKSFRTFFESIWKIADKS